MSIVNMGIESQKEMFDFFVHIGNVSDDAYVGNEVVGDIFRFLLSPVFAKMNLDGIEDGSRVLRGIEYYYEFFRRVVDCKFYENFVEVVGKYVIFNEWDGDEFVVLNYLMKICLNVLVRRLVEVLREDVKDGEFRVEMGWEIMRDLLKENYGGKMEELGRKLGIQF